MLLCKSNIDLFTCQILVLLHPLFSFPFLSFPFLCPLFKDTQNPQEALIAQTTPRTNPLDENISGRNQDHASATDTPHDQDRISNSEIILAPGVHSAEVVSLLRSRLPQLCIVFDYYASNLQKPTHFPLTVAEIAKDHSKTMNRRKFVLFCQDFSIFPTFLTQNQTDAIFFVSSLSPTLFSLSSTGLTLTQTAKQEISRLRNSGFDFDESPPLHSTHVRDPARASLNISQFLQAILWIASVSLGKPPLMNLYTSSISRLSVVLDTWGVGDAITFDAIKRNRQ